MDEFPSEEYCDVYWIKYTKIGSARIAKRKLDNWSFFGKSLHVCYAPESESVTDTREKLAQRRKVIAQKTEGKMKCLSVCDLADRSQGHSIPHH